MFIFNICELIYITILLDILFYILYFIYYIVHQIPDNGIFLTARLAAPEVSDRALLNQCYHPPIGVGRMFRY